MTTEARPTRAEVSDAANAVADGVDAIMLAGETASGAFPARAVRTLDAIIRDAELDYPLRQVQQIKQAEDGHAQALCEAAVTLAERGGAQAIVAVTRGGKTARRLSGLRPRMPILAATDRDTMARRLGRFWGVVPVCLEIGDHMHEAVRRIREHLMAKALVRRGEPIVLVSISDDLTRRDANYLKIHRA
jgi:pyruvate kinase